MKRTPQHPVEEQTEAKAELLVELARATPDLVLVDRKNPRLAELAEELRGLRAEVDLQSQVAIPTEIANPTQLAVIEQDLLNVKSLTGRVQTFLNPFKQWAFKFHRALTGYENDLLAPLLRYEAAVKPVSQKYLDEQERKRRAEEDRINAQLRAEAEAERQRLLKEAAKLKTPELRKERIEQAQAVEAQRVTVPSVITTTKGIVDKKRWIAEVTDWPAAVAYLAALPDAQGYIEIKQSAIDGLAARMKSTGTVPGLIFKEVSVTAVGKR